LVAVFATFALVACGGGKTGTCEMCGKENVKVSEVTFLGETGMACDECAKAMEELGDLDMDDLGDLEDALGDLEDLLG